MTYTRSTIAIALCTYCSTRSTPAPSFAAWRRISKRRSTSIGARPNESSSARITDGPGDKREAEREHLLLTSGQGRDRSLEVVTKLREDLDHRVDRRSEDPDVLGHRHAHERRPRSHVVGRDCRPPRDAGLGGLAGTDGDPDLFWKLFHEAVRETGDPHSPLSLRWARPGAPGPCSRAAGTDPGQERATSRGADGFPTGATGCVGEDLEVVIDHAQHALRLIVLSQGEPALSVQRHDVAGELTRIGVPDLCMDTAEVGDVLAQHGVPAEDRTATIVERRTGRLAVRSATVRGRLARRPDHGGGLDEADRATVELPRRRGAGEEPAARA